MSRLPSLITVVAINRDRDPVVVKKVALSTTFRTLLRQNPGLLAHVPADHEVGVARVYNFLRLDLDTTLEAAGATAHSEFQISIDDLNQLKIEKEAVSHRARSRARKRPTRPALTAASFLPPTAPPPRSMNSSTRPSWRGTRRPRQPRRA